MYITACLFALGTLCILMYILYRTARFKQIFESVGIWLMAMTLYIKLCIVYKVQVDVKIDEQTLK